MNFKSMWKETINLFSDSKNSTKIKNITMLFIQFCRVRNERISQRIAQITIIINLINPKYWFVLNDEATNNERKKFLEVCFNFLFGGHNISSLTVRMQSLFYGRYLTREVFKDHQKQIVIKNCCHLVQKLKKAWHNPTEDFKDMHNDLIKLILIKEGMEDQDDPSAFDEMRTAVNCIFPPSSFSTFVVSNQKSKMAFINDISSIAAGIRLHAWYSHKAGKFMFDVQKIMRETLPKISDDLYEELSNINEKIEVIQEELKSSALENIKGNEEVDYKKLYLIYLKNYQKFVTVIKESIQDVAVETYKLDYKFAMQVKELDSTLNAGPFSKADKVYPSYKDITRTWKGIQLEGHLLNFYSNLFQELKVLSTQIQSTQSTQVIEILHTQLDEISQTEEDLEQTILISPEQVKNFDTITLEYQEFCTFYCSMGILIQCNRSLGIIMYKNLCYGFSSIEAMEYFNAQPKKCIYDIQQQILAMPELIVTFQMETYFNFPISNTFKSTCVLPVFIESSSVQTVLHPIEKNIDYTYNWNQWSLRKKALQYIDLLDKKTHSTQTDCSHFRRENYSQVYLPKDQSTQTRRDAATNISKAEIPELFLKT